jgi:two-component system, NarL family, sensor histidine kinase BarA
MLRHLTDSQTNLRKVNRDLDAKVDELAQLNMRLYEMNRVKSDFLANMSHELADAAEQHHRLFGSPAGDRFADRQAEKVCPEYPEVGTRAAGDDQRYSRLWRRSMRGKWMSGLPSLALIRSCMPNATWSAPYRGEEHRPDLHDRGRPSAMYTDQSKVQQILTNLLSNAIKFTPEGGRIGVQAGRDPEGRLAADGGPTPAWGSPKKTGKSSLKSFGRAAMWSARTG